MIRIYADGSSTGKVGPGGWGIAAYSGERLIYEGCGGAMVTTNNRMEMMAIIRAMRWAMARGASAIIISDSQICIRTLTEWGPEWERRGWRKADGSEPSNLDLVRLATETLRSAAVRLELQWVKGHAGVAGNERADALANEGKQQAIFNSAASDSEGGLID